LIKDVTNKVYFKNTNSCKEENISFNRHLVSHLLEDPDYFESRKNTLRLFCFMDLIAECYAYDHPIQSKQVSVKTSYGSKTCYKYEIDNSNRKEAFKKFFIKCFNSKEQIITLLEQVEKQ